MTTDFKCMALKILAHVGIVTLQNRHVMPWVGRAGDFLGFSVPCLELKVMCLFPSYLGVLMARVKSPLLGCGGLVNSCNPSTPLRWMEGE